MKFVVKWTAHNKGDENYIGSGEFECDNIPSLGGVEERILSGLSELRNDGIEDKIFVSYSVRGLFAGGNFFRAERGRPVFEVVKD